MKVLKESRSCSWHDVPKRVVMLGDAKGQMIHQSHQDKGRLRTVGPQCPFLDFWVWVLVLLIGLLSLRGKLYFIRTQWQKEFSCSVPSDSPVFKDFWKGGHQRFSVPICPLMADLFAAAKESMFLCVCRNFPLVIFVFFLRLCSFVVIMYHVS